MDFEEVKNIKYVLLLTIIIDGNYEIIFEGINETGHVDNYRMQVDKELWEAFKLLNESRNPIYNIDITFYIRNFETIKILK